MASENYAASKAEAKAARDSIKAEAKAAKAAAKDKVQVALQDRVTNVTKKVASAIVDQPEPPWWRGRKPRSTRAAPISRDAIIDAAIAILDAEGADALTVRRLAAELETGPATLYWHIAGKDELGELVYDRLMGEVVLPDADPDHWQDQIKDIARQGYHVMLSHNDAVKLSIGRVPLGPNMLHMIDWMIGLFDAAGIPEDVAGYFGDLLGRYIDASLLEVIASTSMVGTTETERAAGQEMLRDYFASLSPEQFPHLTAKAGPLARGDDDERFEMGLDILLRGLAAYIEDN